jgi:Tol biopolymer transport system component
MTTPSRIERNLPGILGDLSAAPTPDYLDDVFARTGRMRQRPAWTFPERWLPMADITRARAFAPAPPWRMIVAGLIALALIVAALIYAGSQLHRVPAPFGPARNGLIPFATNGDIYVGDPVTGQTRALVLGPEADSGPVTSHDGRFVAFARDVPGTSKSDVYVVGVDGSNLRKITPAPVDQLQWGDWTPDGRQVIVIHEVEATADQCGTTLCNLGQVDLIDADGSGHTKTIATDQGISYVHFRPPTGSDLMYRALVDGRWGLFTMALDGTNVRPIVPPTIPADMDVTFADADYSADGSRIFYNAYTSNASFGDPGCCQLFVVNADGGDPHLFIPNTGDTWDGKAAVSPDGQRIAFWHNLPNTDTHRVTVVNADGTGQPVETGPGLNGTAHWIWAPDSSSILMFPDNIDSGRAYLLDPAGGAWQTLPWTSTGDLGWQRLALN